MDYHGLASDLQEIQRFNFVLMSRSIEVDDEEVKARHKISMQEAPQQFQTLQDQAAAAGQENLTVSQLKLLPFQRRMRSVSPPKLQLCSENYIVYS